MPADKQFILIERKTAKFVQLLLIDVRDYFAGCESKPDVDAFANFAAVIYPRLHRAIYSHHILVAGDRSYIAMHGSASLTDAPLMGDRKLLIKKGLEPARLQAYDGKHMIIEQRKCRLVYQTVEELHQFFQQPKNFDESKKIKAYIDATMGGVQTACEILS